MVNTQSVVQPLKCLCNGALSWQVLRILGSHFSVACSVVSLGMAAKLDRMISLILVAMFINGIHSGVMEFCGYDFGGIHHGQLEMGMLLNSKVNTGFLPYSFIWAFVWTSFFLCYCCPSLFRRCQLVSAHIWEICWYDKHETTSCGINHQARISGFIHSFL